MSEIEYWLTTTCLVVVAALNIFILGFLLVGYML
jgi:hypothetical protein